MNTKQINEKIAQKIGMPKTKVKACIDQFLELITETVSEGKTVNLRGFGVFYPIIWKERILNKFESDITDKTGYFADSRTLFKFRASRTLNKRLNNK